MSHMRSVGRRWAMMGAARCTTLLVGAFAACSIAVAQDCVQVLHEEDFDAYVAGEKLLPQQPCWPDCPPGFSWQSWDNAGPPIDAAIVTDLVSNSPPNSLRITSQTRNPSTAEDIVHTYYDLPIEFLYYEFTIDVYVPGDFEGDSYIMLLSQYRPNGEKSWMNQVHWSDTGFVISDFDDGDQKVVPIRYDEWVTYRVVIDLIRQSQRLYYGDSFIVQKPACEGATCDPALLEAVDFYGNDATPVYYDNVRLCEITPRCAEDFDWDWDVGFSDLLAVLTRWGSNGCRRPEDLDQDCDVDFDDLLLLLAAWGPCE